MTLDPSAPPIIVRVVQQEPTTGFGLADVLIRALGLTGVLLVGSAVFGLLLGAVFIWFRIIRAKAHGEDPGRTVELGLTPPTSHNAVSPLK